MRVLVCGSRDLIDYRFVRDNLERIAYHRFPRTPEDEYGNFLYDVTIIAGKARGVDTHAVDWAVVNWCNFEEYPADWEKYGKRAGYIRNQQMLDEGKPDLVIAFPGGRGTAMMVDLANKAGVEVIEVEQG
jgi:hypothetical protein